MDALIRRVAQGVVFYAVFFIGTNVRALSDDPSKDPGPDPYTKEDPELMAAAGYEQFGPFVITETHNTADVETVTGVKWMLWVETAHFRIGSTLLASPFPSEKAAAKRMSGELKRLRTKLPRVKKRVKEIDPWLMLHLYAQRCEELYTEISELLGVTDSDFPSLGGPANALGKGPYLGTRDKYIVILFQDQGNLARYFRRFTGTTHDKPYRHYFYQTGNLLFATARNAMRGSLANDVAMECNVTCNVVHNLINGYQCYKYRLPLWLTEGMAHWFSKRIDEKYYFPSANVGENVDYREDYKWAKKVLGRVKNDYYPKAEKLMRIDQTKDMSFHHHIMSWSRIDYLLSLDGDGFAKFMRGVKDLPHVPGITPEMVADRQSEALKEGLGMDEAEFDAKWSQWVLKEYRRRK